MRVTNIEINLSAEELNAIRKLIGGTSTNARKTAGISAEEDVLLTNFWNELQAKFNFD